MLAPELCEVEPDQASGTEDAELGNGGAAVEAPFQMAAIALACEVTALIGVADGEVGGPPRPHLSPVFEVLEAALQVPARVHLYQMADEHELHRVRLVLWLKTKSLATSSPATRQPVCPARTANTAASGVLM